MAVFFNDVFVFIFRLESIKSPFKIIKSLSKIVWKTFVSLSHFQKLLFLFDLISVH